ncbi:MAG: nitroreductase family deazaflavin-dependent oxidoreductase [Chloroflexi bacterium]|nr:nitroreductase family deazaflavin-dependent oxidoreductase [Chloroflexota bacterium]MCL5274649.1 nitroreductase family deazaflavin-dependent oxidoreductase [Chloroflexota bacterium]
MTIINQQTEEKLRQGFRYVNRFMLLMWRLGLGQFINAWPEGSGRIMVLTHTGRKSGMKRQTPVNYAIVDGELYCTAGFGKGSDWYRNIVADPDVEVWLPEGWWAGRAEEATDAKSRLPLLREVLIASGFAARAAGIDPLAMSDEALSEATRAYRLLHIRRTAERTGPGGPGDLAWVWPLATFILLPMALFRPRRRRRRF